MANSPAPSITDGLEVLVQLVMAAITTEPGRGGGREEEGVGRREWRGESGEEEGVGRRDEGGGREE